MILEIPLWIFDICIYGQFPHIFMGSQPTATRFTNAQNILSDPSRTSGVFLFSIFLFYVKKSHQRQ